MMANRIVLNGISDHGAGAVENVQDGVAALYRGLL